MFGIVRRKSHSIMARNEFDQGVEHFKLAATHAARGAGATVGPKIASAREQIQPAAGKVRDAASSGWGTAVATLAPIAAAATEGARRAGKKSNKATRKNARKLDARARQALGQKKSSTGRLVGLALAGLAIGAAGAMVLRRRQRQQWDEYDPSKPIASGATGPVGSETVAAPADVDQTSSPQHNPTVARMAGGESPS